LVKERFIALHMMMARMSPLDPSSAPAVISSLLSSTNPIATADRPAYEFRIAMTGRHVRAADRDDEQDAEQQRERDDARRMPAGAHGAVGFMATAAGQDDRRRGQQEIDHVLPGIGDRPLRHPLDLLQLAGRHQTARQREVAEDDFRDQRDHPEGRQEFRPSDKRR
jgi:hypothetical protein